MRDCAIHTTAATWQIHQAFVETFSERPPLSAMLDLFQRRHAKWQRRHFWNEAEVEGADLAVEHASKITQTWQGEILSPPGVAIALRVSDEGSYRLVYLWNPLYTTFWRDLTGGYFGVFKAFARIVYAKIHVQDPSAELLRQR
jgi:hypothetical protein